MTSLMTMPLGSVHQGPPSNLHGAELALRQVVAPVAERALGELHDVALVHERHALALVRDGVLDRRANQPLACPRARSA